MNFDTLTKVLTHKAKQNDEKGITFIKKRSEEYFISYKNLYQKSVETLYNLQQMGIKPNDELILQIDDTENDKFMYVFWACILGRIIPVPLSIGGDEHKLKVFKVWESLKRPKIIIDDRNMESIRKFAFNNRLEKSLEVIEKNRLQLEKSFEKVGIGSIAEANCTDTAFIQFSSGSTGDPKGVVLSHKNLITNVKGIIKAAKIRSDETILSWMPLTHDMGIIGFTLVPIYNDCNLINIPTTLFIRNPILWMDKTAEYRSNILGSPNFGYRYFLDHLVKAKDKLWDLSCVRVIFNGAEPISVDLIEEFIEKMQMHKLKKTSMYTVYGMAEASLAVAFPPVEEQYSYINVKRNSLNIGSKINEEPVDLSNRDSIKLVIEGYPVEGCEFRIVDDEGNTKEDEVIGYIQIRGDNVTKRYNNEYYTKKLINNDGWLNTRDIGFVKENKIVVIGRLDDIIFINGKNHYVNDLEKIAISIPEIKMGKISFIGSYSNATGTEDVIAFIVYKKDLKEFAVISRKLKDLMIKKYAIKVKKVIPINRIPKTTSGKFQRYKLKQCYEDGNFNEVVEKLEKIENQYYKKFEGILQPYNDVENLLMRTWINVLQRKDIDINDNFFEIGGTSLNGIYMLELISELLKVDIDINVLFERPTIKALGEYISSLC